VSTELLHFSLYAVLSYPYTTVNSSTQQTLGPVSQPQTTTSVLPPSFQVAPTTPPQTIATEENGVPIGAIAGGAVGGFVIIGIITFVYNRYLLVRRQTSARVEPIQAIEGSESDDAAHPLLRDGWFLYLCHSNRRIVAAEKCPLLQPILLTSSNFIFALFLLWQGQGNMLEALSVQPQIIFRRRSRLMTWNLKALSCPLSVQPQIF
jgi:hypothetical protein